MTPCPGESQRLWINEDRDSAHFPLDESRDVESEVPAADPATHPAGKPGASLHPSQYHTSLPLPPARPPRPQTLSSAENGRRVISLQEVMTPFLCLRAPVSNFSLIQHIRAFTEFQSDLQPYSLSVRWVPDKESKAQRCARGHSALQSQRDRQSASAGREFPPLPGRRGKFPLSPVCIAPSGHTSNPGHQDHFLEMAKEEDRGLHLLPCPTPTSNDLRSLGCDLPSLCPGWRHPCGAGCGGSPS